MGEGGNAKIDVRDKLFARNPGHQFGGGHQNVPVRWPLSPCAGEKPQGNRLKVEGRTRREVEDRRGAVREKQPYTLTRSNAVKRRTG